MILVRCLGLGWVLICLLDASWWVWFDCFVFGFWVGLGFLLIQGLYAACGLLGWRF